MSEIRKKWENYGRQHLVGRVIRGVRLMTNDECSDAGWHGSTLILQLDNGTLLYASTDDEGNGPGALFGATKDGKSLTFPVCPLETES